MSPIRILIADDHRVYREGVRVLLQDLEDVELIGEAADGDETVLQAERLSPDVILMDPQIAILVLTMYDDDESVFNAMRSGARGHLLKDADQEDLLRAVHAVNRGEALQTAGKAAQAFPELSSRELEVLRLIAEGQSNAAIATRLALSVKTVQNHISNIFSKLQVADRAQAIVRAREAGLGTS